MASIRWVRPDFTTVRNRRGASPQLALEVLERGEELRRSIDRTTARWMADGNTSFDDCDAFTWSFGWTGEPSRSVASEAITSFMFMFDDVPEPVWNTSIGKWSSQSPTATSAAASWIGGRPCPWGSPSAGR